MFFILEAWMDPCVDWFCADCCDGFDADAFKADLRGSLPPDVRDNAGDMRAGKKVGFDGITGADRLA